MGNKKKMTILDFKKFKQEGRKFAYSSAYDYTMAKIINDSDIELVLVGDSLNMLIHGKDTTVGCTVDEIIYHTKTVVNGAPDTFVVGDMPFGSYNVSKEQAIITANRIIMETNCDCIKLEGGSKIAPIIREIVDAGIPVMGHIGLTPQTSTSLGGFKIQGGTPETAKQLVEDAKQLEVAGCFSIVVECVPVGVGKAIAEAVNVPILSAGAGKYADCQWLNIYDMFGLFSEFKPKFCKQYRQLRSEMIDGLNEFHKETVDGTFPTKEYSYNTVVEGFEI